MNHNIEYKTIYLKKIEPFPYIPMQNSVYVKDKGEVPFPAVKTVSSIHHVWKTLKLKGTCHP